MGWNSASRDAKKCRKLNFEEQVVGIHVWPWHLTAEWAKSCRICSTKIMQTIQKNHEEPLIIYIYIIHIYIYINVYGVSEPFKGLRTLLQVLNAGNLFYLLIPMISWSRHTSRKCLPMAHVIHGETWVRQQNDSFHSVVLVVSWGFPWKVYDNPYHQR